MKIKVKIFGIILIILLLFLIMIVRIEQLSEYIKKSEIRNEINEIYKFSVEDKISEYKICEINELDLLPELTDQIGIMYFHLLFNEVNADTFFYLKEKTIESLKTESGETFSSGLFTLININHVENIIVYEISSETTIFRFKYQEDNKKLFYEIKEKAGDENG